MGCFGMLPSLGERQNAHVLLKDLRETNETPRLAFFGGNRSAVCFTDTIALDLSQAIQ